MEIKEVKIVLLCFRETFRPLGYERVYLPLCKVADTPFYIQGDDLLGESWIFSLLVQCLADLEEPSHDVRWILKVNSDMTAVFASIGPPSAHRPLFLVELVFSSSSTLSAVDPDLILRHSHIRWLHHTLGHRLHPTTNRLRTSTDSMLGQRQRRCPSIDSMLHLNFTFLE